MLLKIRFGLASKLFDFYINRNKYDKALPIGVVLAELFEKLEGSDKFSSAQFYARIADMHSQQGRNEKAEQLYKQSLNIAEKSDDKNPQAIVYTMNSLGAVLGKQSKNGEALATYQRALDLAKREVPKSDPIFASLKTSIKKCSAAPNTVAPKIQHNEAGIQAEKRDDKAKQ